MYFAPQTEKKLTCLSSFYERTLKLNRLTPKQRQRIRKDLIERIENLSLFGYLEGSQGCLQLANDLSTAVQGKSLSELLEKPFFCSVESFDPFWLYSAYEYSKKLKDASIREAAKTFLRHEEYLSLKKLCQRVTGIIDKYLTRKEDSDVSIQDYRIVQICHIIMMNCSGENSLSIEQVRAQTFISFIERINDYRPKEIDTALFLFPVQAFVSCEESQTLHEAMNGYEALLLAISYHYELIHKGSFKKSCQKRFSEEKVKGMTNILGYFYDSCCDGKRVESLIIHQVIHIVYGLCLHELAINKVSLSEVISNRMKRISKCDQSAYTGLETLYSKLAQSKSLSRTVSVLRVNNHSVGRWVLDTLRKSSIDLGSEIFEPDQVKAALEKQRCSEFKLNLSKLPESQQKTLKVYRKPAEITKKLPSARMQSCILMEKYLKTFTSDLRKYYQALRYKIFRKRENGDLYQIQYGKKIYRVAFSRKGKKAILSDDGVISIPSKWSPKKKLKAIQRLIPYPNTRLKFLFNTKDFEPLISFNHQFVTYLAQGVLFAQNNKRREKFILNSWKLAKLLYEDQNYDMLSAWHSAFIGQLVNRIEQISDFLDKRSEYQALKVFEDPHFHQYRKKLKKANKRAIPQLSSFLGDLTKSQECRDRENQNILLALSYDQNYFGFVPRGDSLRSLKVRSIKEILNIKSTISDESTYNLLYEASYLIQPHLKLPSKISDRLLHCQIDSLIADISFDLNRRSAFIFASLFQPGEDMVPLKGESLTLIFRTLSEDYLYTQQFYEQLIKQSQKSETDVIAIKNLINLARNLLSSGNYFALLALWSVLRKHGEVVVFDKIYRRRFLMLSKKIGKNGMSLNESKIHLPYPFFLWPSPFRMQNKIDGKVNCPESFWEQVIAFLKSFGSCEINPSSLKTSIISEIQEYQKADKKQNRHLTRARMIASTGEVSKKNNLVKDFVENQLSSGKILTLSYLMSRKRES